MASGAAPSALGTDLKQTSVLRSDLRLKAGKSSFKIKKSSFKNELIREVILSRAKNYSFYVLPSLHAIP